MSDNKEAKAPVPTREQLKIWKEQWENWPAGFLFEYTAKQAAAWAWEQAHTQQASAAQPEIMSTKEDLLYQVDSIIGALAHESPHVKEWLETLRRFIEGEVPAAQPAAWMCYYMGKFGGVTAEKDIAEYLASSKDHFEVIPLYTHQSPSEPAANSVVVSKADLTAMVKLWRDGCDPEIPADSPLARLQAALTQAGRS